MPMLTDCGQIAEMNFSPAAIRSLQGPQGPEAIPHPTLPRKRGRALPDGFAFASLKLAMTKSYEL